MLSSPQLKNQESRSLLPKGLVKVGWQASQDILATMEHQAVMAEMVPLVRRARKEMQVFLVLRVRQEMLGGLELKGPEAFLEFPAGKASPEKALMCIAQHSAWGWRPE